MYQVIVIEKILGIVTENTYGFPTKEQRDLFMELCGDDDVFVFNRDLVAV